MDTPFELPQPVQADRHHYRAALEMRKRLDEKDQHGVGYASADLYRGYQKWAQARGFEPVHINAWTWAMKAAGMLAYTHHNTRMWMLP